MNKKLIICSALAVMVAAVAVFFPSEKEDELVRELAVQYFESEDEVSVADAASYAVVECRKENGWKAKRMSEDGRFEVIVKILVVDSSSVVAVQRELLEQNSQSFETKSSLLRNLNALGVERVSEVERYRPLARRLPFEGKLLLCGGDIVVKIRRKKL